MNTLKTAARRIASITTKRNAPKLSDVIITSDNLVGFVKTDGSYRCMTPKAASQGIR